MAKTCWIERAKRTPKFKVRAVRRCQRCGRSRAVLRTFGLFRICFREMALRGESPVGRKAGWSGRHNDDKHSDSPSIASTHPPFDGPRPVGEDVLRELGVQLDRLIEVYNKSYRSDPFEIRRKNAASLSALTCRNIDRLIEIIKAYNYLKTVVRGAS